MLRLATALDAWGRPEFNDVLKREIRQLGADHLPLQQGLSTGSVVVGDDVDVMIIRAAEDDHYIRVIAGVFYKSIIAGCSCADDPTPIDENSEYCEVRFDIDMRTAETTVALLAE